MAYDLLLKGARVMDPAQDVDGIRDVGVVGEQIAAVAEEITAPGGGDDRPVRQDSDARVDRYPRAPLCGMYDLGHPRRCAVLGHGCDDDRRCWKRGVGQLSGICRLRRRASADPGFGVRAYFGDWPDLWAGGGDGRFAVRRSRAHGVCGPPLAGALRRRQGAAGRFPSWREWD